VRKYNRDLALRISEDQREFLERYAEANRLRFCEGVRAIIDAAMEKRGFQLELVEDEVSVDG
jgi:hypothetical protein